MKVAAKQNIHFSCQVRYQRHAAKYHGSLSSFYSFHKSLLPWSMHKNWLWLRNALKCAPLKSVSWLHSARRSEQQLGKVWGRHCGMLRQDKQAGKMCLSAWSSDFSLRGLGGNNVSGIHRFNSSYCTSFLPRTKVPAVVSKHEICWPGILISASFKTFVLQST